MHSSGEQPAALAPAAPPAAAPRSEELCPRLDASGRAWQGAHRAGGHQIIWNENVHRQGEVCVQGDILRLS